VKNSTRKRNRLPLIFGRLVLGFVLALFALWALGAVWFDFPVASKAAAWLFGIGLLAAIIFPPRFRWKALAVLLLCLAVGGWWRTLQPSHDRDWQPTVSELPYAEVEGDLVTLYNVRNFDHFPGRAFIENWTTREVLLSDIEAVSLAINFWGSPWMSHPLLVFEIAGEDPLVFSVETRKEEGEGFSALGGMYRQFEMIVLVGTERDLFRVRTNHGANEDLYLYRTTASPELARERFLEMVTMLNALRDEPRWYHAITTNCTTAIRNRPTARERIPWDWRILVNGQMDRLLYENGVLETDGLEFSELREQALINEVAQLADRDPEFSLRIREGLAGFPQPPAPALAPAETEIEVEVEVEVAEEVAPEN